jgi:antitoxin component YwqK of YwqJK toxin-antitoxin module
MREGAWEEFSIDGSRQRGNYKHNVREGEWRHYDSSGMLLKFVRYNAKGEIVEEHRFDKPGNQ